MLLKSHQGLSYEQCVAHSMYNIAHYNACVTTTVPVIPIGCNMGITHPTRFLKLSAPTHFLFIISVLKIQVENRGVHPHFYHL